MSSNGAAEGIVSPRHVVTGVAAPPTAASTATISVGVPQEPLESEADGHDSQKKKSAFQITSVVVKSYSEDDNQRQPRSMDDLDDVGTYPSEPGYESFGNGAAPHSPPPPALSGHEHAIAIASLHHPAALLHSSGAAGRNFGGHAQDPKGSRFVVVKVESKDPYTRGRWRCMDFQDESERGDISVVKSADSSGSSRASSVNYTHGVDDPQKNPLLLLHSVPEVVAAKLSAAEQQQSQQFVPPTVAALAAGVDGVLLVQHPANSAASAPDVMLKTGFTNYVANAGANPSVSAAVAAAASQAHGLSAVSHSGLSTGVGQPKPATASSVPAAAVSAGASASLFSSSMPNVAAARTAVDSVAGVGPGVAASTPHDVYQTSVSTSAASIAATSAVSATAVEPEAVAADGSRPSPGLQAGGLPHPVQQLVQPKNAIVIVKPEPLRTMPAAPAPLAMTLGETLGLQVRDEPSANDAQIRETDASTTGVAIDNKIEQAMDLVKSHLMFAVREEVEDLRQQIKELIDEKTRLEYENNVLRAALSPEMLSKLLPPPQPAQPTQTQQSALLKAAAVQPQGSL